MSEPSTESGSDSTSGDSADIAMDVSEAGDETPALAYAPVAEDTILIFDWDDTVLPTTWLSEQGLRLGPDTWPTEEQWAQLNALSLRAIETLEAAKRYGRVIFVTNGEQNWVELSCEKFMPLLCACLSDIKIVSARSEWEPLVGLKPSEWKLHAFNREISVFYEACADQVRNVVSIGDSQHERQALFDIMGRRQGWAKQCHTKSLKLAVRPAVEQLTMEHDLLVGCFAQILSHEGDLDLCIMGGQ